MTKNDLKKSQVELTECSLCKYFFFRNAYDPDAGEAKQHQYSTGSRRQRGLRCENSAGGEVDEMDGKTK